MKRSNFLKSLVTLVIAPKILTEIDIKPIINKNISEVGLPVVSRHLISELNLLIPDYFEKYMQRYASDSSPLFHN